MDLPRTPPPKRKKYVSLAVGAAAVIALTVVLSRLKEAAPTVEKASIFTDTVKRGEMLRQVKGPGTLVPEHIRWITADTAGRVERILVQPGTKVEPGTVLLELANPDVMLQALEAERQLAQAEGALLNLKATLDSQRLQEQSTLISTRTELQDWKRRAQATADLEEKEVASKLEVSQVSEKANELEKRVALGEDKLKLLNAGAKDQLAAQRTQVERLRAVSEFRKSQVKALHVVAGGEGTLSDQPLELGQWVTPGTVLAKVVQPEKLKAELRIPETQARDLAVGQASSVDTHNGVIKGHVMRVAPSAAQGTVKVEIALDGELPKGARPDLSVEGTVELERLTHVLYVGRPTGANAEGATELFKVAPNGDEATRVKVKLGRASVSTVEVVEGLAEGDRVVLSDMTTYENAERLRIK